MKKTTLALAILGLTIPAGLASAEEKKLVPPMPALISDAKASPSAPVDGIMGLPPSAKELEEKRAQQRAETIEKQKDFIQKQNSSSAETERLEKMRRDKTAIDAAQTELDKLKVELEIKKIKKEMNDIENGPLDPIAAPPSFGSAGATSNFQSIFNKNTSMMMPENNEATTSNSDQPEILLIKGANGRLIADLSLPNGSSIRVKNGSKFLEYEVKEITSDSVLVKDTKDKEEFYLGFGTKKKAIAGK